MLSQPNNDDLPINKIQVIGSHNSYKQAIDPKLFRMMQLRDSVGMSKIDYDHIGFADQLNLGLLNLEIDVYSDEKGGKYAHPKGLQWVKDQPPFDPNGEMLEPGFKVFHITDLDFRSNCLTLKDGLRQLKAWSDAHPDHNPIFITIEPKDEKPKNPVFTTPEIFTEKTFEDLDNEFLKYLGKENIITPDQVRGKYATLEDAVLHDNWPTLKQAKGKFLFILDAKERKKDLYIAGHPSLKGRVLFANADAGTPEAAMMILNNPKDNAIKDLVKKGYIIRTRADGDTKEARENDKSGFEAAKASGAQIITTDYYQKSTHFKSDYVVSFDGESKYFRLNPVFKN
ncbi:calcium-dependent phosphoinositide phospholipase C [Mucilaginibacter frigoritolerans]|uniref:Calcium-dependent phosphoinositide phospholipase C n=2 Tax=Mucilaginibacter frigoritolerans TaxID=652788 RepID=A0A562TQX2_9SPHI|nr:calcium-dependent phosphoinositide phospholipase C [Mucilaginibacter frigoritolerans]